MSNIEILPIRGVSVTDAIAKVKSEYGDKSLDEKTITDIIRSREIAGQAGIVDLDGVLMDVLTRINDRDREAQKPVVKDHNADMSRIRDFRQWGHEWSYETHYPKKGELSAVLNKNDKGVNVINPTELARLFLKHVPTLNTCGSNPATYVFNGEAMLWTDDDSLIGKWMQCVYDNIYDTNELPSGYSPNRAIKDAVEEVKRSAAVLNPSEHRFDASWYSCLDLSERMGVPLKNGVLYFEECVEKTGDKHLKPKIDDFSPYWLFTRKADTGYYPNADTTKAVSILKEWMPDNEEELYDDGSRKEGVVCEKYMRLVQYPAQIIIHQYTNSSWKKVYYGYGRGNCGKTTFSDVIAFVFGRHLGAKTKIHNLGKDFGKEAIAGKWFNTPDETHSSKGVNIDEFKDVYGSNEIEVNKKYRHPETEQMIAVGYHAGNTMMKASAEVRKDSAYLRRWIIYHFDNEFPVDPQWESRNLTEELANGMMKLAVETAAKILEENKLIYEMTEQEVLDEFKQDDTVNEFILNTFFEKYPGDIRRKDTLEIIKEGYGIPASQMVVFFDALKKVWNTAAVRSINPEGWDDLPLNAEDLVPEGARLISTGLTNIGVPRYRTRCEYHNDGNKTKRWWYYGYKFNMSADKVMLSKI